MDGDIRVLVDENRWLESFLIGSGFEFLLLENLHSFDALPEEFVEELRNYMFFQEGQAAEHLEFLRWSEVESPHLINRDLAAIALIRHGDFSEARADKVTGLMLHSEEHSLIGLEAALSFCHWKVWSQPLSRWWNWEKFLDVVDYGLTQPQYAAWSACAYLWAFIRQSSDTEEDQAALRQLACNFADVLKAAPEKLSEDFARTRDQHFNPAWLEDLKVPAVGIEAPQAEVPPPVVTPSEDAAPVPSKTFPLLLLAPRAQILLLSGRVESEEPLTPNVTDPADPGLFV